MTQEIILGACHLVSDRRCFIGLGPARVTVRNQRFLAVCRPVPAQTQGCAEILVFEIVHVIHAEMALRWANICHATKEHDRCIVGYPWTAPVIPKRCLMTFQQSTILLQLVYRNYLALFQLNCTV